MAKLDNLSFFIVGLFIYFYLCFFPSFFHMKILTFVFFNDTEVVFLKMIVLSEMFIGFWFVLKFFSSFWHENVTFIIYGMEMLYFF